MPKEETERILLASPNKAQSFHSNQKDATFTQTLILFRLVDSELEFELID